jgi:anti-anti-sigma factor
MSDRHCSGGKEEIVPLEINSSIEGKTARLRLAGEVDAASAPGVRDEVEKLLQNRPERLVLLVENLTFMASAGLRILIFAKQKQPDLKVYVVSARETIVDTLQKTGFYQSVYILENETEDLSA